MSAPAWTRFCVNGHIVDNCPHGHMCDGVSLCPICASTDIRSVTEWGDPDYLEGLLVPVKPIGYEVETRENKYGKRDVNIPIYDISRLFAKKEN